MISPKDIAGAVTAALVVGWGVWTELRMQKFQQADEQLKRKLADVQIVDAVHAESDSQLKLELSGDVKS